MHSNSEKGCDNESAQQSSKKQNKLHIAFENTHWKLENHMIKKKKIENQIIVNQISNKQLKTTLNYWNKEY